MSGGLLSTEDARRLGNEAFAGPPGLEWRGETAEIDRLDLRLSEAGAELSAALDALERIYGPALVAALNAFIVPLRNEASSLATFARYLNRCLGYQHEQLERQEERTKEEQRWRFEHQNARARAEGHLAEIYGRMVRLDRRRPPEWVANILDTFA